MNAVNIISKKRDGEELTVKEIEYMVNSYTKSFGTGKAESAPPVVDYQMAAFLMAVIFRGMTPAELTAYTAALINSGKTLIWEDIPGIVVDKHSSGGVGDKTTLIVAPIAAAAGLFMPKMSGRGLGFTGGTIDKLSSIPGFNTALTTSQLKSQISRIGLAVVGQTQELTPADGKIYALRDVTATVDSIPLIAASIMSKKIAGGASCIVLDVKAGSGAFMKTEEEARILADTMVRIGEGMGRKVKAVVSPMDQPLGNTVGNALEVEEAVKTLKGEGPDDLTKLSLNLTAHLIHLAGKNSPENIFETAYSRAEKILYQGKAYEKFLQMVREQEGDVKYVEKLAGSNKNSAQSGGGSYIHSITSDNKATTHTAHINASENGTLQKLDALQIGKAAALLGAGRLKKEDTIDPAAGIIIHIKKGRPVKKGAPILTLLTNKNSIMEEAKTEALKAIEIST